MPLDERALPGLGVTGTSSSRWRFSGSAELGRPAMAPRRTPRATSRPSRRFFSSTSFQERT
eukprot:4242595-Alexandrium_andersonii.AAC.1